MLLFRSEDHIEPWRVERSLERGASMTLEQQWELARRWYSNRLDADWRRRSPDEAQRVLAECGLSDPFWELV